MNQNLNKLKEGVESALSLQQSDFGLMATEYFERLQNGDVDEVDLYISFKKVEKFVETILPFIKERIDETKLSVAYKKHFVSLVAQRGKPTWNYKNCGDAVYSELLEQQKQLKDREKFLQSITKTTEFTDEETGEVITLNPPIKYQSTNIVMRYDKDEA